MIAKKILVLAVSITILVTTLGGATAEQRSSLQGTVKSISGNTITIEHAGGTMKTFHFDEGLRGDMRKVKVGDTVKVNFSQGPGGKNELRGIIDEN